MRTNLKRFEVEAIRCDTHLARDLFEGLTEPASVAQAKFSAPAKSVPFGHCPKVPREFGIEVGFQIDQWKKSGHVEAFGPHVDDLALVRARTLGAADALTRSAFFRNLARLLPTPV